MTDISRLPAMELIKNMLFPAHQHEEDISNVKLEEYGEETVGLSEVRSSHGLEARGYQELNELPAALPETQISPTPIMPSLEDIRALPTQQFLIEDDLVRLVIWKVLLVA